MKNTEVTTVCNLKGGTAKTTTTVALGYGLANKGYKVLAIDFDVQQHLTSWLGCEDKITHDVYDWINDNASAAIEINENFHLIPSTVKGIEAFRSHCEEEGVASLFSLKDQLAVVDEYDFVLIDVPSFIGHEVSNALVASDSVIIPSNPSLLSKKGLGSIVKTINGALRVNPNLHTTGVFINHVRTNVEAHKRGIKNIAEELNEVNVPLYKNFVRESSLIEDGEGNYANFYKNLSRNPAAQDFLKIVDEYLEKIGRE